MVNTKMHTLFAEKHASLRNYIFAGVRKYVFSLWYGQKYRYAFYCVDFKPYGITFWPDVR